MHELQLPTLAFLLDRKPACPVRCEVQPLSVSVIATLVYRFTLEMVVVVFGVLPDMGRPFSTSLDLLFLPGGGELRRMPVLLF